MSEQSWERRPLPDTTGRAQTVWEWQISRPVELTAARGRLRDDLTGDALPRGADADDVDRLLLTFEEITSNGLRHGGAPVTVTVTGTAADAGTGVAGVALRVTDEYGAAVPVPEAVDGGRGPTVSWTREMTLPGRVRARDRDGRTYRITATATDGAGNRSRRTVRATVAPRRSSRPRHDLSVPHRTATTPTSIPREHA